jgi:hypothetical protein
MKITAMYPTLTRDRAMSAEPVEYIIPYVNSQRDKHSDCKNRALCTPDRAFLVRTNAPKENIPMEIASAGKE